MHKRRLSRRTFLKSLPPIAASVAFAGRPRRAEATVEAATVRDISSGRRGVTLTLEMSYGPFPCSGESYSDATTLLFVPHHFRLPEDERIDTLVHFHGHNSTAQATMETHELREQFNESLQNGILVMPQGPVNASNSSGGKLDGADGLLNFLTEIRRTLQLSEVSSALGDAAVNDAARIGAVILSAHSGGYRVAANCLDIGNYNVNEVFLFDALYGHVDSYETWILARSTETNSRERHKLISSYTDSSVQSNNERLMRHLDDAGISYVHEDTGGLISRGEMTRARAVFIGLSVTHGEATHRQNNLRDYLYASCFRRNLESEWFEDTESPREVEVRE